MHICSDTIGTSDLEQRRHIQIVMQGCAATPHLFKGMITPGTQGRHRECQRTVCGRLARHGGANQHQAVAHLGAAWRKVWGAGKWKYNCLHTASTSTHAMRAAADSAKQAHASCCGGRKLADMQFMFFDSLQPVFIPGWSHIAVWPWPRTTLQAAGPGTCMQTRW